VRQPDVARRVEAHGVRGAISKIAPIDDHRMGLHKLDRRFVGMAQATGFFKEVQGLIGAGSN